VSDMTRLPKLFKGLADPSRLRIMNILSSRTACVCDLQSVLGLAQPFISRHLAYLRKRGLVRDRRQGTWVSYSLALDGPLRHALQAFLGDLLPLSGTFQADLQRLSELERAGWLKGSYSPRAEEQEQRMHDNAAA
jgi:ArsR family transcriptional regulator